MALSNVPIPQNDKLTGIMDFAEFQRLVLGSPHFHDWLKRSVVLAYNDAQVNPLLGSDNLLIESILSIRSQSVAHIPLALRITVDAPKPQ